MVQDRRGVPHSARFIRWAWKATTSPGSVSTTTCGHSQLSKPDVAGSAARYSHSRVRRPGRRCHPGDVPSVASLDDLHRAVADFTVEDLSLVIEPPALAAARRSLD